MNLDSPTGRFRVGEHLYRKMITAGFSLLERQSTEKRVFIRLDFVWIEYGPQATYLAAPRIVQAEMDRTVQLRKCQ